MKVHSDTLTRDDLLAAARAARVSFIELNEGASRKRAHRFEVFLSGGHYAAAQRDNRQKAATWDEWGVSLDALFEVDPAMITDYYDGQGDFYAKTADAKSRNEQYAGRKWMTAPWL